VLANDRCRRDILARLRADAAFPANPTAVRGLEASQSPFLSMPGRVAGIVLDVLS
jgi:hypothetical protein